MEPNHTGDEWLMREAAAGKGDALTALLRRYASPRFTFIQRMIGDHQLRAVRLALWRGARPAFFSWPGKEESPKIASENSLRTC